jgi:hypothetical protein
MEHVVFYQSAQGMPAFRRVASLDDAVSFAEHLRNVEGVTDFSVYALSPVTLSLRAYYHVEVAGAPGAAQPTAASPTAEPEPTAPAPPASEDLDPVAAAEEPYVPGMPFAAAPPVSPPSGDPESVAATLEAESVTDPTVEEVVPSGRRSMGFFARS